MPSTTRRITSQQLTSFKGKRKIAALTAYDATFADLFDQAGVELLLVGDTLGMVVQGEEDTLSVRLEDIIYHCRAVVRGSRTSLVVADLPFMTYQVSAEQALVSAGRLIQEGRAGAVKLEGGLRVCEAVRRMVDAGIPVMGHVGLTPQSVRALGGFRVQARTEAAKQTLLEDALALQDAGVFSMVLEAIPQDVAREVTAAVKVPTVGIGAGPHCDGQVLVSYDLLGLFQGVVPRFAKQYARLGDAVRSAVASYVEEVRDEAFPAPEHCFGVKVADAQAKRSGQG